MTNDYYTVREVAETLNVSTRTVRRWIALRKVEFTKIGGRYYFSTNQLEKIIIIKRKEELL